VAPVLGESDEIITVKISDDGTGIEFFNQNLDEHQQQTLQVANVIQTFFFFTCVKDNKPECSSLATKSFPVWSAKASTIYKTLWLRDVRIL